MVNSPFRTEIFLMDEIQTSYNDQDKKKKSSKSYFISMGLVLVLTFASLFISLYSAGNGDFVEGAKLIGDAIVNCNPWWLAVILILVFVSYCLEGLIILVFCRLYTRRYHWHQGLANSMIGAFYSDVTPGASGGQVMQVYTLKKQGIQVSNAASIMVMWFIIYQMALIFVDIFAIIFEWNTIMSIKTFQIPNFSIGSWKGDIPIVPLIVIGFVLNLSVVALLFLMSYSHRFHNFIMHYAVGFLAKIKIVKNPDKTRENLRVQVENFKIELKRLQANVPVTILIFVLFVLILVIRFSLPYYAGLALDAYGLNKGFSFTSMMDATFRSSFHQMVTGLIPIPGSAGVSELFFSTMFSDFFVETSVMTPNGVSVIRSASANIMAAQIIWRTATFHFVLIVSGLVTALYHGKPREEFHFANRQTFVDIQLETYDERKLSADTLYETRQLSRKEIQRRLSGSYSKDIVTGDASFDDGFYQPKPKKAPSVKRKGGKKSTGKKFDSIDIDN